jgi:alcohol dehydrogenase class IV
MVFKGVEVLRKINPDVIIALGGGSVMDAAKGMWPMWADPSTGKDAIRGLNPVEKLNLRKKTGAILINVPTTSGTGADVTWAVVLTDKSGEIDRKVSFGNRELVADVTILDPILTETLPKHLIAGTGIDALCHAIDGYLSTWNNDFSDALVLHAFRLIWENLPKAYEIAEGEPISREILEKLHNAATMAGLGFSNSQIILSHSLAHSLGAIFQIPHSVIIGTCCWYSLMYNRLEAEKRIADLARVAGYKGNKENELANKLITGFKQLLLRFDLPLSLQDLKISSEEFRNRLEETIEYALNDTGTLSNPKLLDYEDFEKILQSMYSGEELTF